MPGRTSSRHSPSTRAGECAGAHRPSRSRRREPAGAAHRPRTRRRPASHAPSPPDTAVAGPQMARRRAGARAPSAVPDLALPVGLHPAPTSGPAARRPCRARPLPAPPGAAAHARGAHHRQRADIEAAKRGLLPPGRPTPRATRALPPAAPIAANASQTRSDLPEAVNALRDAPSSTRARSPRCAQPDSEPPRYSSEVASRKVVGHGQG